MQFRNFLIEVLRPEVDILLSAAAPASSPVLSAEGVVAGSGFGAIGDFDKLSADRARAGGTSHEKVPRHCQLMD